jgi:hypothetical protein
MMHMRSLGLLILPLGLVAGLAGCGGGDDGPNTPPGALVTLEMDSQVGVLLEDFPAVNRDRVADELLAMPQDWWIERARWQLRLTSFRLVYRKYYFDEAEWDTHDALPLPPEERWTITLGGAPMRTMIDGHDLVVVPYHFSSTIVTDEASPGISEPNLAAVGGTWDEDFVFPVDPTLLFQRTGWACMNEDEFPPESVDAEEAYKFYDDTCEGETPATQSCHYSQFPAESCVEAVTGIIGHVQASLHFERIGWDETIAAAARFGEVTTPDAPDLKVLTTGEGLNDNRIIYKYIPAGHCAAVERCVGGTGWRRLLVFDSHDHNVGGQPLHIGEVDYFNEGLGGDLIQHGVYEFSACHEHYHFMHYGDFSFGTPGGPDPTLAPVQKNGFCLESTDRLSNNEWSPLHPDYICEYQGVQAGWGDLYGASLTCNWVDITGLDTSGGPVTDQLTFRSNPDGFLCEGTLVTDGQGNQMWEPTSFMTELGMPVDRPVCEQTAGSETNDVGSISVTVPEIGGFVTQPCGTRLGHDLGPVRNCGFTQLPGLQSCNPGDPVTISCTGGDATRPQVVRVCETSRVLGTGVDCTYQQAIAIGIDEGVGAGATLTFICPEGRDPQEQGGEYAVYTAPVWEPDGSVALTCAP